MTNVIRQWVTWRSMTLIVFENLFITSAVGLSAAVVLGDPARAAFFRPDALWKGSLIAVVCQVCLYYGDLYTLRLPADPRDLCRRTLQSLGATSLALAAAYFWFPTLVIGRGVFAVAVGLVIAVVLGWRIVFLWLTRRGPQERLLLIGTSAAARSLARELSERQELGVTVVGFIDPDPAHADAPGVIGTIEDVPAIVRAQSIDRVVVSLADARGKLPMDKLLEMKLDGVTFDHFASVFEQYTGKIAVENLRPSWLIFASGFRKTRVQAAAKRVLDVAVATTGVVLLMPVMLAVALAVKLTSDGSVLYRQRRVGRDGRVFTIHKFRSMRQDAEAGTGAVWARRDDDRVTPVGRFLRRARLDELPQLWNVLTGSMSLVGPRPERPEFVQQLTREIPFYGQRHIVKPGVTGWAQVRYTYGASVEDAMEKLQYDLFYIKHMSATFDLFIIFETIKTVILRRGA